MRSVMAYTFLKMQLISLNPKSEALNIHPVRYASNLFLKHL